MDTTETELAIWRHERRRTTLLIAVLVLAILALLFWFLSHRSSPGSPARQIKNVIFGRQITEAAEQRAGAQGADEEGQGERQGQGQGEQPGQSGAQAGNGGAGEAEGQGTAAQTGASGESQGENGRGRKAGFGGPTNRQLPANNPSGPPAPEERSIGWLDRFFGTSRADDAPDRAGQGGTGENLPGSGNTNVSPVTPANPVAAQFTESNPPAPVEASLEEPPPPLRSTNRAPPVANALNDNFEQLLRQHSAGSGDVRISLMWNNRNDIDLHVVEPSGEELNYRHRASRSGGLLDIDMNASPPLRSPAVENIYWPQRAAPAGTYKIFVNHYARHHRPDQTEFTVRVLVRGRTTDVRGTVRFGEAKKLIHQFTLSGQPRR